MAHLVTEGFDPILAELLPGTIEARVHSAFQHAIVCPLSDGLLLTLAANRWGFLPGGVLIAEAHWAQVKRCGVTRGDRVILTARSVHCPDRELTVELDHAQAPDRSAAGTGTLPSRARRGCLQAARRFWMGREEPETGLLEFRQAGCTAALAGRDGSIESAVAGLIGLGPGLTPAGDDYLVGAMVALYLLASDSAPARAAARLMATAVAAHVDRTTSISASYLRYALAGNFAALPCDFARRLLSGADWQPTARRLRHMGATSGRQAALGIIDTLAVFLN